MSTSAPQAISDKKTGEVNPYGPKAELDYQLGNCLIGVTTPERTGMGGASHF